MMEVEIKEVKKEEQQGRREDIAGRVMLAEDLWQSFH
jgi:hypothetical protein